MQTKEGDITPKVRKPELSFLYATRHFVLFYISTIKLFRRVFVLHRLAPVLSALFIPLPVAVANFVSLTPFHSFTSETLPFPLRDITD